MHTMNNEDSEYCLRWHKHFSNFVESFEALLANEALADVMFFVEGQFVKAHKVVLSLCSQYFQNLFKETMDKYPVIVLKDVKHQHIRMLLEFMYTGQVNIPQEALKPIMKAAQTLRIKGLADGVVDIEKLQTPENESPMPLIHPKSANNHYNPPPPHHPSPHSEPKPNRPLPAMYSTSSPSVLSTALTMPSALSLASPISLPHLASLPPNFASTLASSLSGAMSPAISSFIPPRDMPGRNLCESPLVKRRKRHRRRSGELHDSGDSDGRSSGSPGDNVHNIQLPKIPATITPIGLRQQAQHLHQLSLQHHQTQQQPRDLSIHSTENQNSSYNNHHERLSSYSIHRDRLHTIKLPPNIPGLLHHPPLENHSKPIQDEPENLELRPQQSLKEEGDRIPKTEPNSNEENLNNQSSDSSVQEDKSSPLTSGRRSHDGSTPLIRVSPKFSSDPESISPTKTHQSQSRHEETSSDNNHFSDDERDENSSVPPRENPNERLSDSTPGPSSSSRPHSQEAPHTPTFAGWPYVPDMNPSEEAIANMEVNQDYLRTLLRATHIFPQQLANQYLNSQQIPINLPMLLKHSREKSNSKNLLGYPYPDTAKQFSCEKCGRSYASTGNLKRHKKYECGVEPQFSCPHCKKKFQHRHSVKIHIFSTHKKGDDGGHSSRGEAPEIMSADAVSTVNASAWISQEPPPPALQNQE